MKNEFILALAVTAVIAIVGAVTTNMRLEHCINEYKQLEYRYSTLQCEYMVLSYKTR